MLPLSPLLLLVACGLDPILAPTPVTHPGPDAPALARLECDRCHDGGERWEPPPRERSCVDCHEALRDGELDAPAWLSALPPSWTGRHPTSVTGPWKEQVRSFLDLPSLDGVERRLRRSWVEAWIEQPHAVRPGLGVTMPRFPLRVVPAARIVDALYAGGPGPSEDPIPAGDATRGLELIRAGGCLDCHAFSCVGDDTTGERTAPDLRWTRDRSPPQVVLAWLTDPRALVADTPMPKPSWSEAERLDAAAAILSAPCAPPVPPAPVTAAPVTRPVTWDEVNTRVFAKRCVPCHRSDPIDSGPGNGGGFGWAGVNLDLSTRDGVLAGSMCGPVTRPEAGGTSSLIAAMQARHAELRGAYTDVLGMPMALPPVPPDDIALVAAWIDQGAPE